jgi:hypothetical protein
MGGKHAQTRDEKAKRSKQDKHGQWGKSMHFLEMRRGEKVSKTNIDDEGKARTR